MWKKGNLHQKGKSCESVGALGPKMWQNLGNIASEEGNLVKNPRIFWVQ